MAKRPKKSGNVRKTVDRAVKGARKLGVRVGQVLAETPEYVALRRTDRSLRAEMDDYWRAIGRKAYMLHKRSRKNRPFERFKSITRDLESLERVEEEYRENKVRLNKLKEELRRRKP